MKKLLIAFLKRNNLKIALLFIFCIASIPRFLYFPQNIYFGFDQARDAFESKTIYNGDLKIIGPSTAKEGLFHGPLYWYIIGPLYLLGNGNPAWPAGFLLLLNSLGVLLIFLVASSLFNKYVGAIAALLYAFSFEQTQYAMYFGNPGLAVLTILVFYLGLSKFLFQKKWWGISLAFFGLGLSIQFEFFLIYLGTIFVLMILVLGRRNLLSFVKNYKYLLVSLISFLVPTITFWLADIKFGFRSLKILLETTGAGGLSILDKSLKVYFDRLALQIHDNIFSFGLSVQKPLLFSLLGFLVWNIFRKEKDYRQNLFLLIWALSSGFLLGFGTPSLYYSNIGISAGFIILASYAIYFIIKKKLFLGVLALALVLASNLSLITTQNPKGIISDIYVQEGMLLSRQKQAVDTIYKDARGKPIVVSALTMPLKINTTWAYLFNWYGKEKYGYLPYWAGEAAVGYPGNLPPWQSQEKDYVMFSIIEPVRGVRGAFVDQFLKEQEQYGGVIYERRFGNFPQTQLIVQKRR